MNSSYIFNKEVLLTFKKYQTYIGLVLIFFLTTVLSFPQVVQGTLVNLMLLTGRNKSRTSRILLCVTPSVLTLAHNQIFGANTSYLLLLLPIIWISNYLYISCYNHKQVKVFSSIVKTTVIFLYSYILFNNQLIPAPVYFNMGLPQLLTSSLGMLLYSILS